MGLFSVCTGVGRQCTATPDPEKPAARQQDIHDMRVCPTALCVCVCVCVCVCSVVWGRAPVVA